MIKWDFSEDGQKMKKKNTLTVWFLPTEGSYSCGTGVGGSNSGGGAGVSGGCIV